MAKASVSISVKGPLFRPETDKNVVKAINTGLLELAEIEGSNNVRKQLYPGHGFKTGRLHRSIGAGLISDLNAQFDAGETIHGKNLEYASRIEGYYKMFKNTQEKIKSDTSIFDKYIGRAVEEAFS
tara:strand:+ start:1694 stop:2071 length:378 start_codon:yes stop_codon:yes gene_type:complete